MTDIEDDTRNEPPERPWIQLQSTYDVEIWIDHYNRGLQRMVEKKNPMGYGICFLLSAGGEIYMHTTPEGEILLDVTPEAEWVAPVITAATGVAAPAGQVWGLPGEVLTQLVFGLNSLIGSTRMVPEHDFKVKKKYW